MSNILWKTTTDGATGTFASFRVTISASERYSSMPSWAIRCPDVFVSPQVFTGTLTQAKAYAEQACLSIIAARNERDIAALHVLRGK